MSVSDLRLGRQVSMASQPYEVCSVALLLRETDEVFLNSHVDLCIRKVWILFLLLYINSDSLQLSCFLQSIEASMRSENYALTMTLSE